MEIIKVVEELIEYLELDHSEVTEVCEHLIDLQSSPYVSEEFTKAVEIELKEQLDSYKEHAVIVEKEKVIPEQRFSVKELEWR